MKKKMYKGIVIQGEKVGRTIGFPTINLLPSIMPADLKQGVYASTVTIHDKNYLGALYLGPRLVKGENHTILEIYVLDFEGMLYGETISFQLQGFIREPKDFQDIAEMKKTIEKDVATVRESTIEDPLDPARTLT